MNLMTSTKNYIIVQNHAQRQHFWDKLKSWNYLAYDVETTGLNVRKDKVIGFSICGEIGTAFYVPLYSWDGSALEEHSYNLAMAKDALNTIKSIILKARRI